MWLRDSDTYSRGMKREKAMNPMGKHALLDVGSTKVRSLLRCSGHKRQLSAVPLSTAKNGI